MPISKRLKNVLLAGGLAAVLASCDGASSGSYGPLTSSYKGVVRVEARGSVSNNRGSSALNSYTYTDRANDGNSVYVKTSWRYWKWLPLRERYDWEYSCSKSSPEISNRTASGSNYCYLDASGTKVRLEIKACAQMGWPVPDSCSAAALKGFDY